MIQGASFKISILAGLFFPLVIALAWGWRYGLLSALAGGCQTMWWLWAGDGWGVLYSVPVFTLWIVWHGWWAGRRSEGNPWYSSSFAVEIPFRIIIELGFLVVFKWLVSLNPPPWNPGISWDQVSSAWLQTVAVKHTITAYILLMAAYVTLSLSPVRRFFALPPRPAQRDTTAIYAGAALFGLLLWAMDAMVFNFAFPREGQDFWHIAVYGTDYHDLFMRYLYIAAAVFAGFVLARLNRRRVELQELLDHRNRILSAIRNVNQLIVREKNPLHLLDDACRLLVENQGYFNVWIVLTEKGRPVEPFFHRGFNGGFEPMAELLRAEKLPICAEKALSSEDVQVIDDPITRCLGCPLSYAYSGRWGLSMRIEHEGRVFGWICLSCPRKYAPSAEEHDLLKEVVGDIAFALWAIEAEAQRETLAQKYAAVLENTTDAILAVDTDGRITLFNPGAEKLLECSADDAIGSPIVRFCPEDLIGEQAEMINRVLEAGTVSGYETERLTARGRRVPVEITLSLTTDARGETLGTNAIIRDITERRLAEASLEDNYALLRIAGETAKFGGWSVDLVNDVCTWSDAVADIHEVPRGYSPPVHEGISFYAPEWRGRITKVFSTCAEKGIPYDEEMEILTSKGKRVWVRTIGHAVRNEHGSIIRVQGAFQDITEHKQQEELLRLSEERHRLLAENTLDVIWVMTMDARFTYVNPAIETMFGFTTDEWIGSGLWEHSDEVHFAGMKELIENEAAKGPEQPGVIFETQMLRRDGSTIEVEIYGKVIFDDQGVPVCLQGMTRDISERKRAAAAQEKIQAQLNQSQKMESVGRLAGGVAHDYNNMLGVIIGNAELALEKLPEGEPLHGELREILDAARRSADITSQLLAFARWQIIDPKETDLNKTVEHMLKMLQRLIGEDIDLSWVPGQEGMSVFMDPIQLDQILTNLLVNSRDAIEGVGKVTIHTDRVHFDEEYCADHAGFTPGEFIVLSVSDDGCGMDRETMESVFEPFFTTKGLGKGTGLGLSTVYGIVKQNNGFINVYSEPGNGTTFKIYLPRHEGEAPSLKTETQKESPRSRGETVLIVEDEVSILKLTRRMLEHLGYNVLAASTPGEAEALAEENAGGIHLLLTDVVMPEINGRELAEGLRAFNPGLRVLFMSGYTSNVIAHRGTLDSGVNFIQKPFSKQDLAVKVRETLDREQEGASSK